MMTARVNEEQPLRILIADDHALLRRGLREVIDEQPDMEVVAEVADGAEAVLAVRELRPHGLDLVLLDIEMPKLDGITATAQIRAEDAGLTVVVLTASTLDRDVLAAQRVGASGFLSKALSPEAMVRALRDFRFQGAQAAPRTAVDGAFTNIQTATDDATASIKHVPSRTASVARLTHRERQVLTLLASGASDREVADSLVISYRTAKKHVENILRKLDARNRTAAAAYLRDHAARDSLFAT